MYIPRYNRSTDEISFIALNNYLEEYTSKKIDNIYKTTYDASLFPRFLINNKEMIIIKTLPHHPTKKAVIKYIKIPFDENKENVELDIDY